MGLTKAQHQVGLLGGSFDPPHLAHVVLAQRAIEQLQLDCLIVLPTGDAWHKSRTLSDGPHRLKMAQLAFAGLEQCKIDDREIRRAGPSYTIDSLLEIQKDQTSSDFFLIIGEDQALQFSTWHRWRDILSIAHLVVAQRLHDPSISHKPTQWQKSEMESVITLDFEPMAMSATQIRHRIENNQDVSTWVPANVLQYIHQQKLYTKTI
ncbi:MAG: nicotinate (nicotinamide) nucleotide adenylyltransferase [Limnohabitans sp.]|nr:nicotinate (nicotinamide) nucleotide adenylyltransferase [Limnohabitans sp.]